MTLDQMIARIDVVADAQRTKIVSDPVKVFEYQAAKEGALAYQAAGYSGTVPAVVHSWAVAKSWTDQQAADDILQESALSTAALEAIRAIRLSGKYSLPNLPEEDRLTYFNAVITQLKAIGV